MKTIKLLLAVLLSTALFTSCSVDIVDHHDQPQGISLQQLLRSYDLWYIDIHQTTGNGEVPFLQKAFTISFNNGVLYANNNLVGIGATGNGYGIDVGYYHAHNSIVEISHDLDGLWALEVHQLSANKIRLYHPPSNTSYYLYGYQRHTFNYDQVFYDNIHYFLQEYEAWEKIATIGGNSNPFDAENFLQFLTGGTNKDFRSSQDNPGTPVSNLYWDYTGLYTISNFSNTNTVKALTLDYDYFANEYFEVRIINDGEIELYHPSSDTAYRFVGRNFIQFKNRSHDKKRMKIEMKTFPKKASDRKINT